MEVSISLTDQTTKFVINNLYPLYLHDLSEVWGWRPNQYGVFETDDTLTLQDQNKVFDIWWEKPAILIPYLVTVEDIPAGFALVATPPYTPHGTEFYLNEFFILRSFRGQGVAEAAAIQVFNLHSGTWELQTNPTDSNKRAQAFWRKTVRNYAPDSYLEEMKETSDDGNKLVFTFDNSKQALISYR
ncbi:GNAT family N-acetyltransferase [Paenibacillus lutimineralis]|uniref:GNAT family N-acetyltransferase n=1 Tax=Paenibacillus lutimineralis TaxID=2707005 RepID=A0A3Q9I9V5_9BACL|nr:GNAT family N-acetyltransferase [Paenibacillus lutimineralis]AZS16009.1 GNAT family N-acetyltransferase [Paenibacillus lutimineralis]